MVRPKYQGFALRWMNGWAFGPDDVPYFCTEQNRPAGSAEQQHLGVRWLATALAAPNRPNAQSPAFAAYGCRPSQSGGKPPYSKRHHGWSMRVLFPLYPFRITRVFVGIPSHVSTFLATVTHRKRHEPDVISPAGNKPTYVLSGRKVRPTFSPGQYLPTA